MHIAIVGGGPAGLRAAEVASAAGAAVTLYEAKPSVGRKFLVAGRGGLNLTKSEPLAQFAGRYSAGAWPEILADFDHAALQAWAVSLGVETFTASTGRVYPRELKAAPLLRRWLQRLREQGVQLRMRHRLTGLASGPRLRFETPEGPHTAAPDAAILALGGGSWPETGSDGAWTRLLQSMGIPVSPLVPANCGWEVAWPASVLAAAEGQPLKNLAVSAGAATVRGELLITRYGLEGGALYALGPALRALPQLELLLDFRPELSRARLLQKLGPVKGHLLREAAARWRLSPAALALLTAREPFASAEALAAEVKACRLPLTGPRPLAEAISSAGGVPWSELGPGGALRRFPGVFLAGEMIDWEAPTGGYLIHGCLALGEQSARAALAYHQE